MTSHLGKINRVILREVPFSLASALTSFQNVSVNVKQAVEQHKQYIDVFQNIIPQENIVICPADDRYPDCVFVEDTTVIVSPDIAILTNMGNETRRGESNGILESYKKLGIKNVIDMRDYEYAYMDGGDVLNTGRHFFVGLSNRTNEAGVRLLKDTLKSNNIDIPVIAVSVPNTLHYKCCITCVDEYNLIVSDTFDGRNLIQNSLSCITTDENHRYNLHYVENDISANIVRVNNMLIAPESANTESKCVYENLINNIDGLNDVRYVPNDEFTKLDGSLTCRSILIWG